MEGQSQYTASQSLPTVRRSLVSMAVGFDSDRVATPNAKGHTAILMIILNDISALAIRW